MTDIYVKNGFLLTMQGEGVGSIQHGAVAIEGTSNSLFQYHLFP